eukprot:6195641-Pleurochrysis_carterae.AAC.4
MLFCRTRHHRFWAKVRCVLVHSLPSAVVTRSSVLRLSHLPAPAISLLFAVKSKHHRPSATRICAGGERQHLARTCLFFWDFPVRRVSPQHKTAASA